VAEHDLRSRLRSGATDDELRKFYQDVVWKKEARRLTTGAFEFLSG